MPSPQPSEAPAISNSELSFCVQNDTHQPRKAKQVLSYLIVKTRELLERLPVVKDFRQPPKQERMDNAASEDIINGDIDAFINATLDQITTRLAFSENINDVADELKSVLEKQSL